MRSLLFRLAFLALPLAVAATPARSGDAPHPLDGARAVLARLVPHVEAACDARFPEPPVVRELDAPSARALFARDLGHEIAAQYPTATAAQKRALVDTLAHSSVASCLARYSFSGRAIIVVREAFDRQSAGAGFTGDDARDLLASVLAHEAVHALDDAHHGLAAFYAEADTREELRARAMVAEGRAVHLGRIAAEAAGVPQRARELLPGGDAPRDAHAWTLRLTYELGARFAAVRGAAGAADVYAAPPDQTLLVVRPALAAVSGRPRAVLSRAYPDADVNVLSALQLLARYAALHGRETADRLFASYSGGAQALVDGTNVAVLTFDTSEAAEAYVQLAGSEAPTRRHGALVVRAFGPAADARLARVEARLADDAAGSAQGE